MVKKIVSSTKSFIIKCKRVWYALKKPSRKEYEQVAKISAIGIAVLGVIGFVISMIMKLFA
ncbi:MAG: protein translocase SEC61 complex subunit gamma [Nanoarchaeota archaeon]|nr:protein translocase SEC61 complex subunit gamma [Nanoarchaeota archaeon]